MKLRSALRTNPRAATFRAFAEAIEKMNPDSPTKECLQILADCDAELASLKEAGLPQPERAEILKPLIPVVVDRIGAFVNSTKKKTLRCTIQTALRDLRIDAEKMAKPPKPEPVRKRHPGYNQTLAAD